MCERCWCSEDVPVVTGVNGLRPLRGATSLTGANGLPTAPTPPGEKGLRGMEAASAGTGAGTAEVEDATVAVAAGPDAAAGVGGTTVDGAGKLDDVAAYDALSAA